MFDETGEKIFPLSANRGPEGRAIGIIRSLFPLPIPGRCNQDKKVRYSMYMSLIMLENFICLLYQLNITHYAHV